MSQQTAQYRAQLPQSARRPFLTDGGLETTLVYQESWDLPEFAAFVLLDSASGRESLRTYYRRYIQLALESQVGLVLESPTWRASTKWGERIGFTELEIVELNRRAISLLAELRRSYATESTPMVISGCLGPEDDGYSPAQKLSVDAARCYHSVQAQAFADTEADMLCGVTLTYAEEAIGITQAAQTVRMPVAISFTVETDGHLPSGMPLPQAIAIVDEATGNGPAYYMVNCAHPSHFVDNLRNKEGWQARIGGVRANASTMSHAELDACTELDDGDPVAFAQAHVELQQLLPNLGVFGGCCGTDHRHVAAIARDCGLSRPS